MLPSFPVFHHSYLQVMIAVVRDWEQATPMKIIHGKWTEVSGVYVSIEHKKTPWAAFL